MISCHFQSMGWCGDILLTMNIKEKVTTARAMMVASTVNAKAHMYGQSRTANSVPRKKKRNVSVMTAISLTRLVVLRAALCVMFLNVYLCCDSPKAIKPVENKNIMNKGKML